MKRVHLLMLIVTAAAAPAHAQDHSTMDHSKRHVAAVSLPTLPGQDAFGAIAEVVRLLQADPLTDWTTVNIETLRQHLIDMNLVTLESRVRQANVPNGIEMTVTGNARAEAAIRRMTTSHGLALSALGLLATSRPAKGGAVFTVQVADGNNAALIAQVRALGFGGIMTLGNHHSAHHLAMARGRLGADHSGSTGHATP